MTLVGKAIPAYRACPIVGCDFLGHTHPERLVALPQLAYLGKLPQMDSLCRLDLRDGGVRYFVGMNCRRLVGIGRRNYRSG
jgi:hypothetical protein